MKKIILIILFFSLNSFIKAQTTLFHKVYTELSTEAIYDIKTSKNNQELIIAAENGIFKFDGIIAQKITHSNSSVIHKILLSSNQIYGLGFDNHLYKINEDSTNTFIQLPKKTNINHCSYYNGYMYITSFDMVYKINLSSSNIETIKTTTQKNDYVYGTIHIDGSSYYIAQSQSAIKVQEINSNNIISIPTQNKIDNLFIKDSQIIYTSLDSIFYFDISTKKNSFICVNDSYLKKGKVFDIYIENESLYVCHSKGLSIYNAANYWKHNFSHQTIHCIEKDAFGNIWLGSLYDGLIQIPSENIHHIDIQNITKTNERISTTNFFEDNIYIGTFKGKLIELNIHSNSTRTLKLNRDAEIQSIFITNDKIYAYCDELFEIDKTPYKIKKSHKVHSTKEIWVDNEIFCATGGDFQNISNSLKTNKGVWHNCMYFDSSNQLFYLGTKNGVITTTRNLKSTTLIPSTSNENICKIFGFNNQVFVLSKTGKLINLSSNKSINLPFSKITNGVIWENHKLVFFNENSIGTIDLKTFTERNISFFNRLTQDDAIKTITCISNKIFITTKSQLFIINNADSIINKSEKYQSSNIRLSTDSVIHLPYKNNGLEIELKYSNSLYFFNNFTTYYSIDNQDWKKIENQTITLSKIPSGNSSIFVKLQNSVDNISDIKKIEIKVDSPFWQKGWFFVIIALGIIFIMVLIQNIRIKKLQKEAQQKLETERLQRQLISSELSAIRSQMNPHFIFNTLSTIQLKIAKKENNIAFHLTQKFASLLRSILNFSKTEFISLEKEIITLKTYIEFEKQRFDDDIEVIYDIDSNLDLYSFRVPSLITQPIVENSFRHGLMHRVGMKRLVISINIIHENSFQIIIEDNGIGIEASKKINIHNQEHESFAMDALQTRLDHINSSGKINIQTEIQSNDMGTIFKILIHDEEY